MINIALCGIGRAGVEVVRTVAETQRFNIAVAFCRVNSEKAGKDIGALTQIGNTGIKAVEVSQAENVFRETKVDVAIDFSNPGASRMLLNACRMHGIPGVICTTGFTDEEVDWMIKLAWSHKMGIVYAPNVTLGINVLLSLMKMVTRALPMYDYQITETHHNRKHDIPSGTAKRIADTIIRELPGHANLVPINSVRAGGYIGLHEVLAAGECERLSITHESFSRRAFAKGALTAADFIINKKGWYHMEDVIDINSVVSAACAEPEPNISRA